MRTRDPEQRQQKIADAVSTIVREKGVKGLTVRSIADVAGVSPALVQHRLGSRPQLLAEVLMLDGSAFNRAVQRIRPRKGGTLAEQVSDILLGLLRFDFTPERLPMIQAARAASWEWNATAEIKVTALLKQLLEPIRRMLKEAASPGRLEPTDVEPLIDLLIAAFNHALRRGIVLGDFVAAEQELERLVHLILGPRQPVPQHSQP
jgi:AcrR family transcriptional regulator